MKKKVLIGIIAGAILVVAIVLGAIFLMPKDNGEPMYTTTTTEMHTHEFGEWEIVFLPTCEMEGKEQRVCACGETISQAIAKVDHSFGNWETVNAATCSEEGERKGFCEYCHLEKSETIPATEIHTLSTIVPEFDYCGEEQVRSVYCSVCEEYVTSFGHHYIKSVIEATCTEDGEIRYTCDKCGDSYYTVISAHGHIESDEQITMNPTCEGQGLANVTCIICDTLLEVVTLESTGHEYTCTSANGKMTYTCTKCNHSYYEAINDDDLSVTFMSDGEEITKVYVAEGTAVTYMPTLTKEGYDLAYWAIDDGTDAPYDSQYIYEDTVLVAVWEEVTVLDTHYSDISNFPSVETSFTFKVVAENEEQIRKNLTIYDIGDNEVEYSVRALSGGKYEISSDNYCEGEFYYAIAEGNVTFVGTESREIQFSIAGENRVEIEISDSVKWLEYSDVYGVIDGNNEKLLLTKNTFSVGDNVAIFEDTHENIVLVIKILSVGEQMGYNAYGFEVADYEEVFNKMDVNFTGDLSDGTVTIDPAAEENIRSAFMSSSLYASARCAAMDWGRTYDINISGENIDAKLASLDDHILVTIKYTIDLDDGFELNIIYKCTYFADFEYYIKNAKKYSVVLTTIVHQSIQVNLRVFNEPDSKEYRNAQDMYLEKLLEYLDNKQEDFLDIQQSEFEEDDKYIDIGGVDIIVGPVTLRFSLGFEFNFEFSGTIGANLEITTTTKIGIRNNKLVFSLCPEITGTDYFVQGKARAELLLRAEIFANVSGFGVYVNVGLGPYVELGGVGGLGYDGNRLYLTKHSVYLDAGHRQEINLGFKFELLGMTIFKTEYEAIARDHSFSGMPLGSTEIWLGFEDYLEDVYITGSCDSNNQFNINEIINTVIRYQDLKEDMAFSYKEPDSITNSLNSVSGYRSRITFTNDKITFDSIGEDVTVEIKLKVNDLIYKIVTVHYVVNHEDGCSHFSCANGYHIGGTATCTDRAICDRCELEYGPEPTGHIYNNGIECTVCGYLAVSEGLNFRLLNDGTYAVVGIGECTDQEIVIPNVFNGMPVTRIADEAFKNCTSITSVTILDSVTSIGKSAFAECTSLLRITIPNSVTSIGESAFYRCRSLYSVDIPGSLTKIENWTFANCTSLYRIEIPETVTSIGKEAFYYCESLEDVRFGNSITSIGKAAFYGCKSFVLYYRGDVEDWLKISFPHQFENGTHPMQMASYVYFQGELLTNLVIPDSVTSIGVFAFYGCKSITSVTIPDSVTAINDQAFQNCTSLTSVIIGDSVRTIGKNAFNGCLSLVNLTVGTSVENVATDAFSYMPSLQNVYYNGSLLDWLNISFDNTSANPMMNGANIYFNGILATNITIPSSMNSIGISQFESWTSLTNVTIPNTVRNINKNGFMACTNLENATISSSVRSIDDYAFAFCVSLQNIYYEGTIEQWKSINKSSDWDYNTPNYTVYCTNGTITKYGAITYN